ncbi:hypothetical protein DFH06DRAFT_393736 [Mycena polygramma]|nr:hypothetical protein DFH06DRAFT_393736 [Mycena polygramma]
MKCNFRTSETGSSADRTCDRCRTSGRTCIVEGRKPRSAPVKREYFLAQLRHKDAIIESLLKQLHNPYIATPLSIASYRMATSPSDTTNHDILTWLDRLQASVRASDPSDITAANFPSPSVPASGAKHPNYYKSISPTSTNPLLASTPGSNDQGAEIYAERAENEDKYGVSTALPGVSVPFGLIANMSLSLSRRRELDENDIGVANAGYFLPGPATDLRMRAHLIEEYSPPEILVHGLVLPEDVEKLFEIFYARVNPFVALLDPVLHTPASTLARCPFLFTVVCAISSRYYPPKSEIYPIAMHFARHSAVNALIDGWKSVELCQAYILMSIYSVPSRKWEEDRSWLYVGLAIRLATDLNLHEVQSSQTRNANDKQERELLNRTRVWMICSIADRSMAAQFGKPTTLSEHCVLHWGDDWYKNSPYNNSYDIHMCAHADLLRVMAAFNDDIASDLVSPNGSNKYVDLRTVTMAHDAKLTAFTAEWSQRFAQESDTNDRRCVMRCKLLPFLVAYSRLVMFSVGFQQVYEIGFQATDRIFFTKCLESATAVVRNLVESLTPTGFMHYSPDGHFFRAAFAAAFLLKLLRPEFSHMMSNEKESQVYDLIGRLIQTLSSPDIAIDDHHTPKLYARFLARLLSRHRRDAVTLRHVHTQPPSAHQNIASSSSTNYRYQSRSGATFAPPGAGAILSSGEGSHSYEHTYRHSESMATPIFCDEETYSYPSMDIRTMQAVCQLGEYDDTGLLAAGIF